MNAQRTLAALTLTNLVLFAASFTRPRAAQQPDVVPVLRGRALEIVDERGQVRASITLFPADSTITMPDGSTGYPATVLLRLRDSHGHPNVKIEATDDGAGLILGGSADPTYVQALARGVTTSLKLSNKDGRVQVIRP
jgi:hypothetical protein